MTIATAELARAERDHREADEAFRTLDGLASQLQAGPVLTTRDLEGREKREELDGVERVARLAAIRGEREDAARILLAARRRLAAAKRAAANDELPVLVGAWEAKAERMLASRDQVEQALAGLFAAVWAYEDDCIEEAQAARSCFRVASPALSENERETLRLRLISDVPVEVREDGVETRLRPEPGLFDGDTTSWLAIGQALAMEPRHARGLLADTALVRAVDQINTKPR
jgi:hypothetical protein